MKHLAPSQSDALLQLTPAMPKQVGQVATQPTMALRELPGFLTHIGTCISKQGLSASSLQAENLDSSPQGWEDKEDLAWRLMAEAHAMDILAVEAFMQPRAKAGEHDLAPTHPLWPRAD